MTLKGKILFHQVNPAKLGTDIIAAIVSLYFLWKHELVIGLVVHFVPPPIGSCLVLRFANLEPYQNSRLGAYLVRYMTRSAQVARLFGDFITVIAAWYHSVFGIIAGLVIILCAWLYGVPFFRSGR